MNEWTVVLARPLNFEGNFVMLDHGQGVLTLYLHLPEIKVKEGDTGKRGEVIGFSGGTGRGTGPNLHVAVRWKGTYLDPARLMQLRLPAVGTPQQCSDGICRPAVGRLVYASPSSDVDD